MELFLVSPRDFSSSNRLLKCTLSTRYTSCRKVLISSLQYNEYAKSIQAQEKFLYVLKQKNTLDYFNNIILGKLNEIHNLNGTESDNLL